MLTIRGVSEPLATLLDGRDPGGVADRWFVDNGLTNLTLFRHYLMHYLAERTDIIKEMYIVARTLKPSPRHSVGDLLLHLLNALERLRKHPVGDI